VFWAQQFSITMILGIEARSKRTWVLSHPTLWIMSTEHAPIKPASFR
jgi:hypothetical protein